MSLNEYDKGIARQAGGLAFDIMRNKLHLPLVDGKVNLEKIEDEIVIGMYAGELGPLSQEVVDLAIGSVQDMVDEFNRTGNVKGL